MNGPLRLLLVCLMLSSIQGCTKTGASRPAAAADTMTAPTAAPSPTAGISDRGAVLSGDLIPAVEGIPPDPGDAGIYRIGPHDLLEVEVFRVEELSSVERVNDSGFIIMPLIGRVAVGGLTPGEAEQLIGEILSRDHLHNPSVSVFVNEYASQHVTVSGSVKQPGVFPLNGRMTLVQAVAHAQGLDEFANDEEVIIFRDQESGGTRAYVVNLELIQEGKLSDPVLIGDDRVMVPQSGTAVFLKGLSDTLRGFVRMPL